MSVTVKIGGVVQYVLDSESGRQPERGIGAKILDGYNSLSEKIINGEIEMILKPVGMAIKDMFLSLISWLNANSLDIIMLGVLITGFGMMVTPLISDGANKWLGRFFFVIFMGSLWRMFL